MCIEHRATRWARGVAHVAVPVLAGTAHSDWLAVLRDVRDDDDLGVARHAPALAEDVEVDLAKAAGEGNLLRRGNALVAEKNHSMFVIGSLDHGENVVAERLGKIDTADLGAERRAGRND